GSDLTSYATSILTSAFAYLSEYSELELKLARAVHAIVKRNLKSGAPSLRLDRDTVKQMVARREICAVVSLTVGDQGLTHAAVLATCPGSVAKIPSFEFSVLDICNDPALCALAIGEDANERQN